MIKELFILDADYKVTMNKEWIPTIKEFKAILHADKGSKGDSVGRKKLHSLKVFTFIYHYVDFKSQFRDYPEEERHKEALLNAELVEKDITVTVKDAIERYKSLQETRSLKLISSAYNALDLLREYFEDIDLEERDLNGRLVNSAKDLINNVKQVGGVIDGIRDLERIVKKELSENAGIRGQSSKGEREDIKGTELKFS